VITEGSPFNGALIFSTGLGTSGTYNSGTMAERMRITGSGGISFGATGTAYGTTGQVLTSNGNAPPTWQTASSSGVAAGILTGTTLAANVVNSSLTTLGTLTSPLTVGTNNGTFTISSPVTSIGGQVGGSITILGGQNNNSSGVGGNISLIGGTGGNLGTVGGNVILSAGTGASGGAIVFNTPATGTQIERFRILNTGAWSVGTGGAAYGTSGQVLTSNGNAAPTWQAAAGSAETQQSVTAAASTTLAYGSGPTVVLTMNASITALTLSGAPISGKVGTFTLFITQGAAGSRTITWPASVKWANGVAPTLTTTATKTDIITLTTFNAGSTWYGLVVGQNF